MASLARPGGNITGLSNQLEETIGKLIETLKESVPGLVRLAVVHNPNNPVSRNLRNEETAASRLGIEVVPVVFRTPDDLAPAFATIARERADGLFPHIASPIGEHWPQLIEFVQKQGLPTVGSNRRIVELGGLFHYGPDFADLWYRTAHYVDRVLRGTKPANLPIEQPSPDYS